MPEPGAVVQPATEGLTAGVAVAPPDGAGSAEPDGFDVTGPMSTGVS